MAVRRPEAHYVAMWKEAVRFWERRRWRRVVWYAGTIFAVLLTNYWIADEIYPFVNPV